ncbi:hypothetical protein [Actinomadura rudentiformis]|uniref:Secreted protein n=1 Tax=Actinomadura rudentiformis TaxID=359158 RepID=A0A6H9YLP1_9ACTN|nr:hypothetical protein [Actinomadura rudentiformis]KAB2341274.1 hypothetical protein F8566_41880 [Actinomadura rudentiformis]
MNVRRSLVIVASLAALTAGIPAYAYVASDKASNAEAAAATAPSKSAYVLKVGKAPAGAALGGMAKNLKTSSVTALLNDKAGNRKGSRKGACATKAAAPKQGDWFCFDSADTKTVQWYPQGVTGTSDAQADGSWGKGGKALLVSWYDNRKDGYHKSARVTFVNLKNNTYRHAILVWPYKNAKGKTTYEPVGTHGTDKGIHAGGLAWYGNRLYVADTSTGIRVFDMRQIFDLGKSKNGSTSKPKLIGLHGKTYYGYGYRYVMPQVASYVPNTRSGKACTATGTPNHSWLSIDRAGKDKLITGEFCMGGAGRVAAFPIGSKGGSDLVMDKNGRANPSYVVNLPVTNIQGGVGTRGNWWFTRNVSKQEKPLEPGTVRNRGQFVRAKYAGGKFTVLSRSTISYGPEDLSCYRGTHQVWTVAEHPEKRQMTNGKWQGRVLYGMPAKECR